MDPDRVIQLRNELRAHRRAQGLPARIEHTDAVDQVTAVLLAAEDDRLRGVVRPFDD